MTKKVSLLEVDQSSEILIQYDMTTYNYDGCALGMKDQLGMPLKKLWTVATNHSGNGRALSKFQCVVNSVTRRAED
jgi:hypothetical protein